MENIHCYDRVFQRLALLRTLGLDFSVIYDIGASTGIWTRQCMEIFPKAAYFCVEPLEEHQKDLAGLEKEFDNITCWSGCLGEKKETGTLYADGSGSSLLKGHWDNSYGTEVGVNIETIDNFVSKGIVGPPDLIKLDVQGAELKVLAGAATALATAQAVIMEVSFIPFQTGMPVFHEVVARLSDYGFLVSDIMSILPRPLDNMAGQADVLFIKKDHPLLSDNRWDHDTVY